MIIVNKLKMENPNAAPNLSISTKEQYSLAIHSAIRKSNQQRKTIADDSSDCGSKQNNVHEQLLINPELSLVQSAREYKSYKSEVKRWTDIVNFLSILSIGMGSIFFVIGLLELCLQTTPLFIKIALLVFKGLNYTNLDKSKALMFDNIINGLLMLISLVGII